ncbi:unnamed protein product [Discosporangium mesarthrocarpum]
MQVRNAMDRARMNSAIRVFNGAVHNDQSEEAGMVSERDLAIITKVDFKIILDELRELEAAGKTDAIVG